MTVHEEDVLGKAYDARLMRRLLAYVKPYRGQTALAVLLIGVSSLLRLVGPLATAVAIDLFIRPPEERGALSGVSVDSLTPETARRLNLPPGARGVVVTDVDADSGAADAGLQRGDVIEEVNRQPVASPGEFEAALKKAGKQSVLLRMRRGERANFIVVKPRE